MSGGPFAEQRALDEGRATARLPRGVVTVAGPDRLTWLDSMTSQSLAGLEPDGSAEALLLDPNGRVEHALRIVDDGATAWLIVDEGEAEAVAAFLDRMRFLLRVEVTDRSSEFAVVGYRGEGDGSEAGRAAAAAAVARWRDPWSSVQPGGWQYAADPHPAADWSWTEAVVPAAAVPGGLVPASAFEALRIAARRPTGADVDERMIPHEVDWLRSAVHLSKGCYRGQETVAKVHNLGAPPRRLVFLDLDGSDSVYAAAGDEVVAAGTDDAVGTVLAAAVHYELGPIALALVRRRLEAAQPLEVLRDGTRIAAAQEVVVPPDAGHAVDVPRLPRLGARRR